MDASWQEATDPMKWNRFASLAGCSLSLIAGKEADKRSVAQCEASSSQLIMFPTTTGSYLFCARAREKKKSITIQKNHELAWGNDITSRWWPPRGYWWWFQGQNSINWGQIISRCKGIPASEHRVQNLRTGEKENLILHVCLSAQSWSAFKNTH